MILVTKTSDQTRQRGDVCMHVCMYICSAGRPGSSEVPCNPLTRWDVSSIPANVIFLTKKLKNKTKNAQRMEND